MPPPKSVPVNLSPDGKTNIVKLPIRKIENGEPPVDPNAPPPKPLTDEEKEQRRKNVMQVMGWEDPEPTEETPPAETPPKEETPPVKTKAEPPVKPAKKPSKKPAAAPQPSADELISRAAREVGTAVARELRPTPEDGAETTETGPELTPEDQRDLEIARKMEEMHPERYKGIAQKMQNFFLDSYKYEAEWRKAHPGQEFDHEDKEHDEFFQRQPEYAQDDFDDAKLEVRVDKKVEQKLQPIQRSQAISAAIEKAKPIIAAKINDNTVNFVRAVNPDLAKLIVGEDGRIDLSTQAMEKLETADPIAKDVMHPIVVGELVPMIRELRKTDVPELNFKFDPKNPTHARVLQYIAEYEDIMARAPDSVRYQKNKQFIPLMEKTKLEDEIINNPKLSQQAKDDKLKRLDEVYWTVTVAKIEKIIIDDLARKAKSQIDRLNKVASKKFGGNPAASGAAPASGQPAAVTSQPAAPSAPKPKPPSHDNPNDVVTGGTPGASGPKSFGEQAAAVHFH